MPSRSVRRVVAIVAIVSFAALAVPVTGLYAAQSRTQPPVPAKAQAPESHSLLVSFLLRVMSNVGTGVDSGVSMDNNG